MLNKVTDLLIGKDISRTALLADNAVLSVIEANIAEGEVVVLDKNYKIAPAAVTFALSNVIYIAEGSADTYSYVNEAGTAVNGARRLIVSSPIDGRHVRAYNAKAYTAKVERSATYAAISGTIAAGTEFVLRLSYADITEHPGLFTQTYRYISKAGDASEDVFNGLRKRINKHKGSRVVASGTTTLILTAKPIPSATTNVDSIDDFSMVKFEPHFTYVDNTDVHELVPSVVTLAGGTQGVGTWESIRDLEKRTSSYRGITNLTVFPVIKPTFRTVKGGTYTIINITHDTPYLTPDNQRMDTTPKEVVVAINGNSSNQGANIQTRLNAWMASLPNGFANISVFS